MNRQLALKLVSKMQTNVWDLTDKQAEIILSFLERNNKRSEQLKDFKTDSFEWLLEKYTQTSLRDFLEKEGYFTGITKLIDERINDLNL